MTSASVLEGNTLPARNLNPSKAPELEWGGKDWGSYSAVGSLPNVAADAADVAIGDVASVGGVRYVCTTATSGSAVWKVTSPTEGAAWLWPAYTPDGGALTALGTSVTASASTVIHYTDITIPHRRVVTGVGLLVGTTLTTDSCKVHLFDSSGALLASSASTLMSGLTADTFNQIALTAAQTVSPGRYFVGVSINGTTAEIQCLDATHPIAICEAEGSHVYATPDDLTSIATTFTADVAPIFYLY